MPKRVDANQRSIVAGLRSFGASVWITSDCGHGAPDLVCGWQGKAYLFEVKTATGKLTKDEWDWQAAWQGDYHIVRNVEDAVRILMEG
jgi:hypothetical protein